MLGTVFEHFKMEVTQVFSKPQRRMANEGVRIAHLNPETKDEFRQGTNVMMVPARGVGSSQEMGTREERGHHLPQGAPEGGTEAI